MRLRPNPLPMLLLAPAAWAPAPVLAFGPAGHRIAGELAEPLLCAETLAEIETLAGGESLAELGLWADRIRGDDAWRHTGPWHYMNIDGPSIESFEHPPEGDVLWAIRRHAELLTQPGTPSSRAEALRFLVHFVVDVHQPLHVGRESDRGGNTIDVRFRGESSNLHRFWDSDVLRVAGLSESDYAARVEPLARMFASGVRASPSDWAAESLALRPLVYAFARRARGPSGLDEAYLEAADAVIRVRLAQAGARLAATLNELLGGPSCRPPA